MRVEFERLSYLLLAFVALACTNLSAEYEGKSGYGLYADGIMELDDDVGELLDLLDELGVTNNTLVMARESFVDSRAGGSDGRRVHELST